MECHTSNGKCPSWISENKTVTFASLVGSSWNEKLHVFDAMMAKDDNWDGAYAFSGDYVTTIDIDHTNQTGQYWTLHPKELIRTHPVWRGAPTGIHAASWCGRTGTTSIDTSHAFLFTDTHVYLYRTNDTKIVYRNQICY